MKSKKSGSKERDYAIIQNALDAVVEMDGKGRITFWNPQAESKRKIRRRSENRTPPSINQTLSAIKLFCQWPKLSLFRGILFLTPWPSPCLVYFHAFSTPLSHHRRRFHLPRYLAVPQQRLATGTQLGQTNLLQSSPQI